jgi:hypothetical protein
MAESFITTDENQSEDEVSFFIHVALVRSWGSVPRASLALHEPGRFLERWGEATPPLHSKTPRVSIGRWAIGTIVELGGVPHWLSVHLQGEEILDDELLAAMESESESGDDTPDVSAGHRGGQTAQGPGGTLEALGEDVVMRVLRMLAPTQLCRFSKVCHWAKELSNGNSLWKGLYFDRWDDPRSHHLERSANRDGWKRVYAARDMAGRAEVGLALPALLSRNTQCAACTGSMNAVAHIARIQCPHVAWACAWVPFGRMNAKTSTHWISRRIRRLKMHSAKCKLLVGRSR